MRGGHGLAWAWAIAGIGLALPQGVQARDETRLSADVTATGGYSENPFTEVGNDTGSAFFEINARPKLKVIGERSVLTLAGLVNYQHFLRRYSDSNDYEGSLDYVITPTSRLTAHGNVQYDSSIIGAFDTLAPNVTPGQPQPPITTGPDLSLFGSRQRRRNFSAAGDGSYALSDRASVTFNAFYDAVRYGGLNQAANYDGYGGGVGYSRKFSPHLRLGVQGSVSRYVYQGLLGNDQVYSLQTTINDDFSSRWNLSGSLGVSYSERTIGGGTVNLTGDLRLCRTTTRATFCATAREAVLPTGATGTTNTKAVGASYSYRLTEHDTISAAADYSRNEVPSGAGLPGGVRPGTVAFSSTYVTVRGNYDRTLTQRIHLLATTQYRKVTGNVIIGVNSNRPDDFGGTLGVSVKLGDYR